MTAKTKAPNAIETPATLRPGYRTIRIGPLQVRVNVRVLCIAATAAVVTFLVATFAMTLGTLEISIADVARSVVGMGEGGASYIVRDIRLPRILVALAVGALLAMSGAIFQGMVRNELASPDIIGINSGASFAGLAWMLLTFQYDMMPMAMFVGAFASAVLIYVLSWKGGLSTNRLVLVGIGVQMALAAYATFLSRGLPPEDAVRAQRLLIGTLNGANWDDVGLLAIALLILAPAALVLTVPLRAMQFGDDVARATGWSVEWLRFLLIIVGCALSVSAIMVGGLIGFVALMVPHMARSMAGAMSGSVMILTAVLGGVVLLAGDLISFHLLPVDLPVSLVMGAVGAPYLIIMFWRQGARAG